MKLKYCKSCGKEIAKNARICPHCGHKYSRITGCISYVLIFLVVTFMIGYVASNLSNNNSSSISSSYELAQRENAEVGETNKVKRADTRFKNTNNSYIVINFYSIKKHELYNTNNGQKISNAVIIKNVTDLTVTRNFVKNAAYFVLYDNKGSEINLTNDIWTQTGKEFSEIIIPLNNKVELNNCKYILIGGFDKTTNNGKSKLVFTIGK